MHSLLARARSGDIVEAPFPHLVIQNALVSTYYDQLAREFPDAEIILHDRQPESNRNFRYTANDALNDTRISRLWKEFIRYHVSQDFFCEVRRLFRDCIRKLHPHVDNLAGNRFDDWETSIRFREPPRDILLECQFAYGAPVERVSRMIGPHVDRECALYAGLFYMRDDRDDSDGGALEFYRFAGEPQFAADRHYVPDDRAEIVKSVPYGKNTFVLFLHSPHSLHGVSPRSVTVFPRRHINLVGELTTKVFDVGSYVQPPEAR